MTPESGPVFAAASRLNDSAVEAQATRVAASAETTALLESVNIPVFVLNGERQIVHANAAFQALTGAADAEALIGERQGEALGCVHADAADAVAGCGTGTACRACEALRTLVRAQTQGQDERRCILALIGGGALNAQFRATRVMIGGEPFLVCALLDIGDTLWHRDIQAAFLHDLLNIAGSIRSTSEALPRLEPTMQKVYLGRIQLACDAMIDEIESHRLMLRAEDGSLDPHYETVDSLAFLQDMAGIMRQHEVCRERRLVVADDSVSCAHDTDRGLLSRVLINLMKNALEAIEPGQTVTTRTGTDEGCVWFSVQNQTVMPEPVARGVFSRFYSTRGAGRGIGTYSARLLTERYLGGRIGFTTDAAHGTVFTVTCPLSQPQENRSR